MKVNANIAENQGMIDKFSGTCLKINSSSTANTYYL
jgi:hypothetical protein